LTEHKGEDFQNLNSKISMKDSQQVAAKTTLVSAAATTADKKRPAAVLTAKTEVTSAHLDLGRVDRGLVNLRGRGEAGLEIAGQNSSKVRIEKSSFSVSTTKIRRFH
jgi:hypothetical protein